MLLFFKRLFPQSLLSRSLIIVITPLLLIQFILSYLYFDKHLESVWNSLSRNIVSEISLVVDMIVDQSDFEKTRGYLEKHLDFEFDILDGEDFIPKKQTQKKWFEQYFLNSLEKEFGNTAFIDSSSNKIHVYIQKESDILQISIPKNRLLSRSFPSVLIWTFISAFIFLVVASIFMRNQVRPIKRLAKAAEQFGRGEKVEEYIPEGALEVRQAGLSFLLMKERITHLLNDRMKMLAGISHDMRTVLTRLKLQVSLQNEQQDSAMLTDDLNQMESMLEEYLDYSRGVFAEKHENTDIAQHIRKTCADFHSDKFLVKLKSPREIFLPIKINTFNRLLTNLVLNSRAYATRLNVEVKKLDRSVEVVFDDNGPGVPESERNNVLKPFYKLDTSRSSDMTGVGLGLSIVKDAVRIHGGNVILNESPLGGLRVILRLPVAS